MREVGKEADRGQAIPMAQQPLFLERLVNLRELPPLEDFGPDEESGQFIRERLSGRSFTSTLEEAAEDIDDERSLWETATIRKRMIAVAEELYCPYACSAFWRAREWLAVVAPSV